uniref:Uncharacterized protein n=1 Tax=Oryza barthii TaxID=65489 RepID=A0A0D3F821_9ORYZ
MGKRYLLGMWTTTAVAHGPWQPDLATLKLVAPELAGLREGRRRETALPAKGRACRRVGERFLSSKQEERNEKVMVEDGLWLS